jgi:LmbE family N-acetylglucosaminyl deacetylase
MINGQALGEMIKAFFGDPGFEVDGVVRRTVTWPDWVITTRLDNQAYWQAAQRAILCHRSQLPSLGDVSQFGDEHWQALLAQLNTYYRIYSQVPVPPGLETDLFTGLR